MAIPFLNHINLSNNEVQNVRLHNTASITVSSGLGHLYFDTDDGLAKYYRANNDWVIIDPITDASLSGSTLTLTRIQNDLTVDLSSLTPTLRGAGTGLSLNGNDIDANVDGQNSIAPNTSTNTANRTYKVQTDSSDNLVVNVPWSDTDTNTVDMGDGFTVSAVTNTATTTITESDTLTLVGAATNNFITTESAADGTIRFTLSASGTRNNTTYLRGDNTFAAIDTITGTTYDLAVGAGGANSSTITLDGSDSTTDTVTIEGSPNTVKVTESSNTITLDLQDDVTIAGKLTVTGDLQIDGATTTVESTITTFTDPIIELNKVADGGTQGNPSTSSGVQVKRSGGNDVQLVWMEDSDDWEFQAYNHRPGLEGGVQKKQYKLPTSYKTTIGGATSIDVDHYLGTRDVIVQLYDTSSYETVYADVTRTSEQTVTIDFTTAPGAGDVTVLIISAQGEQ